MVRNLYAQNIRPRVVIDVGANKGQFMIAAREIMKPKEIVSFEPLPDAAHKLSNLAEELGNVTVHECALGSTAGQAVLHVNSHSQSSSLRQLADRHLTAFPTALPARSVVVDVRRLDDSIVDIDLSPPTLLKIDTQGYEAEVLAGGQETLKDIDWIVTELSFAAMYEGESTFRDVQQLLQQSGFEFQRPVGQLRDPHTGVYLQMDALFTKIPS